MYNIYTRQMASAPRVASGKYLQTQLQANIKHRKNNPQYYRNKRIEYYYLGKLRNNIEQWLSNWSYTF